MNIFRSKKNHDEIKPTRYYSTKQETEVAKALNGKRTPNSGATMFNKADVTTDNWLIECKTCVKDQKSFSIKKEWIEKNTQESCFMGKPYTAISFNFGPNSENYYIIDEITFKELLAYQDKGEQYAEYIMLR